MAKTPLIALLLAFTSCSVLARTVIDDAGTQVEVPDQAKRIADGWYAHHSLMMTLGAGDRIVATVNHPEDRPWMFKIQPSLGQALQVRGKTFSSEALVAQHVDAAFVASNDPDAAAYRQAGIPTLMMRFDNFDSMKRSLLTTAQVIGSAEAIHRAEDYNRYLDQQISVIGQKTATLRDAQRPSVLHIQSLHPLKVDGRNTLIDTWIELAGGKNAASQVDGNMKEVSPEALISWDPDIIIVGEGAGNIDDDELFNSLRAVKQHRVWQNPAGVFPWDRYGTEVALQIQWAASKLHPDLFPHLNIVQATQAFYQRFYNYPLNENQAKRILAALPPQ